MSAPSITPYTVHSPLCNYASIMYDGKVVYQASDLAENMRIHRHAERLNAAFAKGVETERARCMNVAFDTVHSKSRAPSHTPTANRLAKLASLRPKLNEMTAPALEAIESGEPALQPPIYLIAEREPVFPCYLYTNVRTSIFRWVRYGHESDGHFVAKRFDQLPTFAQKAATHWSPDAPRPPSIDPSST